MARLGSTLVLNSETKWNKTNSSSKSSNDLSSHHNPTSSKKSSRSSEVANLDTFRKLLEAGGIGKTQGVDWAAYESQLAELHSMVVSERAKSMSERNKPVSGPIFPGNKMFDMRMNEEKGMKNENEKTSRKLKSKSILDKISPVKLSSRSKSSPTSPPPLLEKIVRMKSPNALNASTPPRKFVSGPLISPSSSTTLQKENYLPSKSNTSLKPHEQLLLWHKQLQQMQEEKDVKEREKKVEEEEKEKRMEKEKEKSVSQKARRSKSIPLESPFEQSQEFTRQESSGSFSAKTTPEFSPLSKTTKAGGNLSPLSGVGFSSPRISHHSETDSIRTTSVETEFEYSDNESSKVKGSGEDKGGGHPSKGWLGRVFSKRRDKSPGSSAESSPQRALKSILAFQHDLSSEFFKKGSKSSRKQEIMRTKSEETSKMEGDWKGIGYAGQAAELARGWSADLVAEVAVLEEDVKGLTQEDDLFRLKTNPSNGKNGKNSDGKTSSVLNDGLSHTSSPKKNSDGTIERSKRGGGGSSSTLSSSSPSGLPSPAYSKDFLEHISKLTESIQKKKVLGNHSNSHQLNCRGNGNSKSSHSNSNNVSNEMMMMMTGSEQDSSEFRASDTLPHRHNLSWPSPEMSPSWSSTSENPPYESLLPKSSALLSTKPHLPKPNSLSRSGKSANWASELARLPPLFPNSNPTIEESLSPSEPWKTSSGLSQPLSHTSRNGPGPLRRTQSQELNMRSLPKHFDPEPAPQVRGTQKWYSAELNPSLVKSHLQGNEWMSPASSVPRSGRGDYQPPFTTFASSSSLSHPGGPLLSQEERGMREEEWYSDSALHDPYRQTNHNNAAMSGWVGNGMSGLDQTSRIHELNKAEPISRERQNLFGYPSSRDRLNDFPKMNCSGRLERTMSAEVWDNEVRETNPTGYSSASNDHAYDHTYARNDRYSMPVKVERRAVSSGPDLQSFPRSFSSDERYQPPGMSSFRPQPNRQILQYHRDPEPRSNRYPSRFSGRLDSEYMHSKMEGGGGLGREMVEDYAGDSARMFLQDVTVLQQISPGSFVEKYALQPEDIRFGRFSVLKPCICRSNGQRFAVKLIRKHDLLKWQDIENVRNEISSLKLLRKHPNVVHMHDCYEDDQTVHLVLDNCDGGDLANRIKSRGRFSERKAAVICTRIISVLRHCQEIRVMHRDLRPENILLSSGEDDTQIRIADFGIAGFLKHGSLCTDVIGVSIYSAPEILHGPYGLECDIWSAGVILYFLLSGALPFHAANRSEMQKAIGRLDVDLNWQPWNTISSMAKDLVRRMLTIDPRQRITASEILCHPWIVG